MDNCGRLNCVSRVCVCTKTRQKVYENAEPACFVLSDEIKLNVEGEKLVGRKGGSIVFLANLDEIDRVYPL